MMTQYKKGWDETDVHMGERRVTDRSKYSLPHMDTNMVERRVRTDPPFETLEG